MILGALVDAGLPLERLRADVGRLGLAGVELRAVPADRRGLRGTLVEVLTPEGGDSPAPHRGLRELLGIVEAAGLSEPVAELSARVLRRLAEVEARVHGTSVEELHFHEVGAVDTVVDVVGAVAGL